MGGTVEQSARSRGVMKRIVQEADVDRELLIDRWFELTKVILPGLARDRRFPVRFDHCFQRILLDHACGGPWRKTIAAPAYRNADGPTLRRAVAIGEALMRGEADCDALNTQSLVWRGKSGPKRSA